MGQTTARVDTGGKDLMAKRGEVDFQPNGVDAAAMEEFFRRAEDPWCYKERPDHIKRAVRFSELLGGSHFNRMLDVGCCEGYLTHMLGATADYVLGIDVSATAVERARRDYGASCKFEVGSVTSYQPDAPFDLVLITGVLYYASYEPGAWEKVAATLKRCLAPAGVLLTSHIKQSSDGDGFRSRFERMGFLHREGGDEFLCDGFTQSCHVWTRCA
jgi:SAM-dependent methyltransferase